ncbi:ankyrin repeat domain-containing protein 50-like [Achlya hypogyna]|uniref:Ankyrin repeat domain-containing protein 50-like n=1 Tax=Achlya hypogyna TaxID=1202772 RepID=A0A1V9YQ92_ACHHY|nr:ankyrin repeat domain-containing protein 50-like [Achlya hypogyna]
MEAVEDADEVGDGVPHRYKGTFPHLENPTEKMQFMARRLQLWYFVFRPKTHDPSGNAFKVFRELYSAKLAVVDDTSSGVLRKWFRIYLKSQRAKFEPSTNKFIEATEDLGDTACPAEAVWRFISVETMQRVLEPLHKDSSDSDIYQYLNSLPSLWLALAWRDAAELTLLPPKDSLFHIVVRMCANVSSQTLSLFYSRGVSVHHQGAHGRVILHAAAEAGHLQTFQKLMIDGADMHAVDEDGATPLHVAAIRGHICVVQYLVEMVHMPVEATTSRGRTALHLAAENGHISLVKYLLAQGSNINAVTTTHRTALHCAVAGHHIPIVKLLLEHDAAIQPNASGNTMLHDAAKANMAELLQYLVTLPHLEPYATARNGHGHTPLHVAAASGAIEVYVLLNGNPWRGRHAGLVVDVDGHYALTLLLRSEATALERDTTVLPSYLPRNATMEELPIWNDAIFGQVLHETPQLAWAFLDAYCVPVARFGGSTKYALPKLDEMYGTHLESSLLAKVIDGYDILGSTKRAMAIQLLRHPLVARLLRLKWKSFARRVFYLQFFGSALLLATTTIGISMTDPPNNNATVTSGTFYTTLFIWLDVVFICCGAIVVTYCYEKVVILTRTRIVQLFATTKAAVAKIPVVMSKRRSSWRGRGLARRSVRKLVARHCNATTGPSNRMVAAVICTALVAPATASAGIVTLFVMAGLGSPTNAAHDTFMGFNQAVQWLATLYVVGWEILEFRGSPHRYLLSVWNCFQMLVYSILLILPLNVLPPDTTRLLLAPVVLLLYLNFLEILRMHDWTGPMITMVLKMLGDVRNFLVLYSVFQMGLTCVYFALLQGLPGFTSFPEAFVSTYLVMFGLSNPDVMLYTLGYPQQYVLTVCFMFHFLAIAIVLLNALIATMTKSIEDILDQVTALVRFNHAMTVLRAETSVPVRWRTKLLARLKSKKTKTGGSYFFKTISVNDTPEEDDSCERPDYVKNLEATVERCVHLIDEMRRAQSEMEARLLAESAKTQAAVAMLAAAMPHKSRKLKLVDLEHENTS